MSRKLFTALALVVIASMLFAACKPAETETPVVEPTIEEPVSVAPTKEPTEKTQPTEVELVTIDFWIPSGRGRDEGVAAVVEAFEAQHPNIKIEVTGFPFMEYGEALRIAMAGNDPPDAGLGSGIALLAHNGALLPLDEIFTEEDLNDFMPDLIDGVSLNGIMYAAPWEQSMLAMFYNVDYFNAAGIAVPKTLDEAWTWAEFLENVKAVQADQAARGNEIWGMVGLANPLQGGFFSWQIIRSNSEPGSPLWETISPDMKTVSEHIDTPEAMEAYEFFQSMYKDEVAPLETIPDALGNGLSATYMAIPTTAPELDAGFPDLNWDVMPAPYLKTPLTHTGSMQPVVAAKSDNPDEAKEFIAFFTSREGLLTYFSVTKFFPSRQSLQAEIPDFQEGYLKLLFDEAVEWGVSLPGGPVSSFLDSIIYRKMMKDIALGADIEEAVAAAVAEVDAQLAQFK